MLNLITVTLTVYLVPSSGANFSLSRVLVNGQIATVMTSASVGLVFNAYLLLLAC